LPPIAMAVVTVYYSLCLTRRHPPSATLFPYTTLFRSVSEAADGGEERITTRMGFGAGIRRDADLPAARDPRRPRTSGKAKSAFGCGQTPTLRRSSMCMLSSDSPAGANSSKGEDAKPRAYVWGAMTKAAGLPGESKRRPFERRARTRALARSRPEASW